MQNADGVPIGRRCEFLGTACSNESDANPQEGDTKPPGAIIHEVCCLAAQRKGRLNFMGLPIPTYLDYCSRTAVSDEHERSASSAKNSVSGQPGYHQQAVELIIKKTFLSRIKKKSTKIKK